MHSFLIFFIVGVGRSGTSLLQSILSSHSQICIPPETGFLRNVVFSRKNYQSLSLEDAFVLNPRLERVAISREEFTSFEDEIDLYKNLLSSYKKQQHKSIVGDKDPRLVEFISGVSRLFPKVQFIHMIRDPRDVLLSKKKQHGQRVNLLGIIFLLIIYN